MTTPHRFLTLLALVALGACADESTSVDGAASTTTAKSLSTDAAVIAVGRAIFFDDRLSLNGNQSCAACHAPAWGWTGPNATINAGGSVYEGSIAGAFGDRKPPSSAYATQSPILHYDGELFEGGNFWDGRATGERLGNPAAEQALGPFLNPAEQALPDPASVIARICAGPYSAAFLAVAGTGACDPANTAATYDFIGSSIAAFEASPEVNAFTSKFDHYLTGQARLTPQEHQGLGLFTGKGKCAACHVLDDMGGRRDRDRDEPRAGARRGTRALFTDFTFDNLGIPKNPVNPQGQGYTDRGLRNFLLTRGEWAALADANDGKHKVPTLRNVDKRPTPSSVKAYGHNGYFKTLV
ncbi:MAG TPA: cytochrome c peroxidase, partial [Gemmatimonadales bacterium]|nr:cytochrome c peroxidase [Gemmatimonadales bacterium]